MATSSQVSQNKRQRDESWNDGLALPEAKRTNGGLTLEYDSYLMALFDKIDNMSANICNPEESDVGINRVINSLEDEIADQMHSNTQGELTAGRNSKTISVTSEIGNFTYYDDVPAELDFFVDQFTPDEIIMNHIDGDSIPNIMYLDAVHSCVETNQVLYWSMWEDDISQLNEYPVIQNEFASPQQVFYGYLWEDDIWQLNEHPVIQNDFASPQQVFYGPLWEDDIWQFNEHPVIQNDFASPQQEEFGINGADFHDVWN
jgi:hypothetical protein